jgi:HD-GYP domain-containing protein (c-di-GMP phosphodiesterase class II)
VAEVVYQHHERMDGSGYPRGLEGASICTEARVLTVADVVEAIASHRPYRPALGVEFALAEISRRRGSYYDPDVVDACLELFGKDGFRFHAD